MSKQIKKFFSFIIAAAFTFCFYGNNLKTVSDEIKTLTAYATNATYGDATNDGVVDVFDLIIAREKLATEDSGALDLDGNDVINGVDLSLLNDFLLGSCDEFPVSIREQMKEVDYSVVDDRCEKEFSLTKEMAEFTESLGTPLKIYEYLYNNIDISFYRNLIKGSIGTFEEKCGNDIDQACLLIAMLNHLGYNAGMVKHPIAITEQQLLEWTGCQSVDSAKEVLEADDRAVSVEVLDGLEGNYFIFPHIFVIAEIDSEVHLLDTSFKKYKKVQTAYDELDLKIDENIYENFINCNLMIEEPEIDEEWFNNLDSQSNYYMKSNVIEQKTFDVFPSKLDYFLLNSNTINETSATFSLNDSKIKGLEYNISTDIKFDNSILKYSANPVNTISQEQIEYDSIGFSFGDGTLLVRAVDLYGTNVTVSYNEMSLKHELRVDDTLILESPELPIGDSLDFSVTSNFLNSTKTITAGEMISVVFDFERISPNIISYAYSDYLETTEESLRNADLLKNINESTKEAAIDVINNYENLGKLLRYIGVEMYSQAHIFNDYLSQMADIRNENGIVFSLISYQPTISQGKIEKQGNFSTNSAICNNAISRSGNEAARQSYNLIYGMYGSTLEKKAFEKILGIYCLSPIDILNEAQLQGTDLVTINSFNKDELANLELNIHQSEINKISSYIDKGYNVTLPRNFVYVMDPSGNDTEEWGGIAYILTIPENGTSEYRWYGGYGYEGESSLVRSAAAITTKFASTFLASCCPFLQIVGVVALAAVAVSLIYAAVYVTTEHIDKINTDLSSSVIVGRTKTAAKSVSEDTEKVIENASVAVNCEAMNKRPKNPDKYYVYFGIKNKKPVYVGITNNIPIRFYQHNYRWKKLYGEDVIRFNDLVQINPEPLTKNQARGVEQVIYERNKGEFQNKIGSISVLRKDFYNTYTLFAIEYLKTNIVYNIYKQKGDVK